MRTTTAAVVISLIAFLAGGTTLCVLVPESEDDAIRCSESFCEPSDVYIWSCPESNGYRYEETALEMHISQDEFEDSMHRHVFRQSTRFVVEPCNLVDPSDRYVRIVADHILSATEGYSSWTRAQAALSFVQCAIGYCHDDDLYGREEFWATPLETLYLHRGDCEDTAVLLCSILIAMGYDSVLLSEPGHLATGVYLGGELVYCETTGGSPGRMGAYDVGGAEIYVPSDCGLLGDITNVLAGIRSVFIRAAGA